MQLAGGRWLHIRSNNAAVRSLVNCEYEMLTGYDISTKRLSEQELDESGRMQLMDMHSGNDRHSNLNIAGGGRRPTWEFRLWNSTRSAWRMRMFCGISKAFMDPEFIRNLEGLNPPQRVRRPSTGINLLAQAADQSGYNNQDLPEALMRQAHYLDNKAGEAPPLLTIG